MDREEEMIKDFESAANCKYNGDTIGLILCAMQWADEHPLKGLVDIDKAYEWLKENVGSYIVDNYKYGGCADFDTESFLSDFKKAMNN